jgi:D-arabinose 1-dehydrogenase-like Zn-dependent alcohol dehydrogenase
VNAPVIEKPRTAAIREVPNQNLALGKLSSTLEMWGICGTDFRIYEGEFISPCVEF